VLLPRLDSDPLLVLNGDSCCEVDLAELWRWHATRGANATLCLVHLPDTSRFGRVAVNEHGGIEGFVEKAESRAAGWINAGVYVFSQSVLEVIPPGRAVSLEREILPARLERYQPSDLDALISAGEVVWAGVEPLGERDGRIALFLTDHVGSLWRGVLQPPSLDDLSEREQAILDALDSRGALFFASLQEAAGGGFPQDTVDAMWNLVWRGLITNDTLQPLRAQVGSTGREKRGRPASRPFRSRRVAPPAAEGRWTRLAPPVMANATAWTMICTAVETPSATTNCTSCSRKTAATTVASGYPRPPSSDVPPSTTTATETSRKLSPSKALGWAVIPASMTPARQ